MVSKHYAFVAASGSSVIRSVGLSRVWVVVSSIASGRAFACGVLGHVVVHVAAWD